MRGVIFKNFFKKLREKHSPDFFRFSRLMSKVLNNIKNTKKYYAPFDQILGQKVWFTGKVWKHTLINFFLLYLESPFNLWKNDTRMKFLGGVVSELWPFLQYGSTRRPENSSGHNFWPVGRIFVKLKNLDFLHQN